MALNEQDRAWIREQIDSAFRRRSFGQKIRDWLPVTAVVAIAIFALTQWTIYVEFRTKTNYRLDTLEKGIGTIENRLGAIEQTLVGIKSDLSRQSLINQATLPLPDFRATLTDLRTAIATAQQQKVKVAPKVVSDLQHKLTASTDAPDFWPTAAHFISYRSQVNVADLQNLLRPDMPNCTDKPPAPMDLRISAEDEKNVKVGEPPTERSKLTPALYENCRFILDSPEEAAKIPFVPQGRAFDLKFKNCQIIYNGGPIAVFSPKPRFNAITGKGPTRTDVYIIQGQRLFFENCLFLFAINSMPPPEGQVLTEQILTQNGNTITVTFSHG